MIKKLVVLNGTEGHKFEVGKEYVFSDINQVVKEIFATKQGYTVILDNKEYIEMPCNTNVMLFYS